MLVAGIWVLALLYNGVKQVYGISAAASLGALAIFLTLQAVLALALLLGLAATLAFLGFAAAARLKRFAPPGLPAASA